MVLPLQSEAAHLDLNENPRMVSAKVQHAIQEAATTLNRYPSGAEGLEAKIAAHLGQGLTAAPYHGGSRRQPDPAQGGGHVRGTRG